MAGFASISVASALKVASLDLCADEYLLMLARPHEVASVTRLAQDPDETPLWRLGRRHKANRGTLESVVAVRPTVVLTMGGAGRSTGPIAEAMRIRAIDLVPPNDLDGVAVNLRTVAGALGDPARALPLLRRLERLRASAPRGAKDAIYVSGGGSSLGGWSAGIQWMRLAGLQQRRLAGSKVTLETLLTRPPAVLLRSDYRAGQMSAGQRWFDHPVVRRLEPRTVTTDGRRWTCAGPLMIDEVERLRGMVR